MLKKIALAGIFAVASIVSFKPATVNAKQKPTAAVTASSVGAPIMSGMCPSAHCPR